MMSRPNLCALKLSERAPLRAHWQCGPEHPSSAKALGAWRKVIVRATFVMFLFDRRLGCWLVAYVAFEMRCSAFRDVSVVSDPQSMVECPTLDPDFHCKGFAKPACPLPARTKTTRAEPQTLKAHETRYGPCRDCFIAA